MCYCLVFCVSASGAGEAGGRRGEENAWTKIHKIQFAVYVSDKPKQGYDNAKFEKPHLNSVCGKANNKGFVKQGNMSTFSVEYVQKSKIVIYS